MSRPLWRLLLTCVLLIALPLKGVASVSLMPCGPDHGVTSSVLSEHDTHESATADHDDADGQETWAPGATQSGHVDGSDLAIGHHHDAKFKCGNCAPCCLSLAPSGSLPMVLAVQASVGEFPSLQTRYISAEVGSSLRPPQFLLA